MYKTTAIRISNYLNELDNITGNATATFLDGSWGVLVKLRDGSMMWNSAIDNLRFKAFKSAIKEV